MICQCCNNIHTNDSTAWEGYCSNCLASEPKIAQAGGNHFDQGKTRLDLLPLAGLEAGARAMAYGADKYGDHNYMKGIPWGSLFASAMRHLLRWFWDGRPDPESGLSDLDHAIANLVMLAYIVKHYPDLDNRPCKVHPPSI